MERLGAEQDARAMQVTEVTQGDDGIHGTMRTVRSVSHQGAGHSCTQEFVCWRERMILDCVCVCVCVCACVRACVRACVCDQMMHGK